MQSIRTSRKAGFTLIEILIIAPIVILVVGAFIGFAVTLTGDSLRLREKNVVAYDVQAALEDIETNVVQATGFLDTSGALLSPQGKDDSTTAFSNTTSGQPDTLITRSAATTAGPFDANRSLIYTGTAPCNSDNAIYEYTSIFFVKNGSLYKRTVLNPAAACAVAWQRASCSVAGLASNPTLCKAEDEKLLDGVTDIDVQYYADSATSTALASTDAESAKSVSVGITLSKQVAGEALSYGASVRVASLNIEAGAGAAAPGNPTIAWTEDSSAPFNIRFDWDALANVTGYNVEYKIGSGAWTNGPQNTTALTFEVAGTHRKQTIEFRLTALSPGGNFEYGTATGVTARWMDCSLLNSWSNFGSPYSDAGYTKTSSDIVGLHGVIKNGGVGTTTAASLCTLPVGFRPATKLIFQPINSGVAGRIDVYPTGEVVAYSGGNSYLSLDGIVFMSSGAGLSWTNITYAGAGGWHNYGTPFSNVRYALDSAGRVQVESLAEPGTLTAGTVISSSLSAAAHRPSHDMILNSRATASSVLTLTATGSIVTRGISSVYNALNFVYYPSTFSSWNTLALTAPWVPFGAPYSTGQCYKGADDLVIIRGVIKSGANGSVIANTATSSCGVHADGKLMLSGWYSTTTQARIDIATNGDIEAQSTSATWTSMDSLHFIAD